jgi:alpha-L-fucosidase 2
MDSKRLTSISPATRWEDAFPTGNGSIGILIYGNICNDTVIFNHEALWIPSLPERVPDISKNLPELREMMLNGEYAMMDYFLDMMFKEQGVQLGQSKSSYHPACEIAIQTSANKPFKDYRRILDLESGCISVEWIEGDQAFKRRYFVSRTRDLICMKFSGDAEREYRITIQPRGVSEENRAFQKSMKMSDIPIQFDTKIDSPFIIFTGTYQNGEKYGVIGKITRPNEHYIVQPSGFSVKKSQEIEMIFKIIPNISDSSALKQAQQELMDTTQNFDSLLEEHQLEHATLFNRLDLSIQSRIKEQKSQESDDVVDTLDYQLLASYNGDLSEGLIEKLFYFGRFLLICSSRPTGWPANLQGVWNGNYFPAWSSDYHNDENVQMNYWAALPGNLAETTLPFFEYYEQCIPDCQENARKIFGARGIFLPIAQTIKGKAPPYGGPWLNWTAGAGWLSQLFYDYWLFTRDAQFLKAHAIPYLKEVALFYEDFLFKGKDGKYVFCPSLSPENVPDVPAASLAAINATMDVAVAKEVFTNLCEGCEFLGIDHELVIKWRQIIQDLPKYAKNEDGAMREWLWPGLKDNYKHRHLSHIYGLFPGFEITQTFMPEIYEACRIAVEKRQVVGQMSQSGWSLAHMANIYARLQDGNRALDVIHTLIRSCVGPNLFTYHNDWRDQGLTLHWNFMDRIFQIDANFGITAAILEMLLFSNRELISILPACPNKWIKGSIKGIMARGGIKVDIVWYFVKNTLLATFLSKISQEKLIRLPKSIKMVKTTPLNKAIKPTDKDNLYLKLKLSENLQLTLNIDFQ